MDNPIAEDESGFEEEPGFILFNAEHSQADQDTTNDFEQGDGGKPIVDGTEPTEEDDEILQEILRMDEEGYGSACSGAASSTAIPVDTEPDALVSYTMQSWNVWQRMDMTRYYQGLYLLILNQMH